jgi:hypothetical protein
MLSVFAALFLAAAADTTAPGASPTPPPPPPMPVMAGTTDDEDSSSMVDSGDDEFGDVNIAGGFSLRSLTQVRFLRTWPAGGNSDETATVRDDDGWRLQRQFLRLSAVPNKRLQAKLTIDFAEFLKKNTKKSLKLAYAVIRPFKWLEITAGLFKRRFSLLELLPIADFELTDEGLTDNLIKDLGFGGRDIGASFRISPLAKKRLLSIYLGAYAGDPEEGYNTSIGKLLNARIESKPFPFLRLGIDGSWRTSVSAGHEKYPDYLQETTTLTPGKAFSADVTYSANGLEIRAEVMYGDRTDAMWIQPDVKFLSTWALAAYRFKLWNFGLMPAVRFERLDGEANRAGGARVYATAGINLLFTDQLRLLIEASRYSVEAGSRALTERPWPTPASGPDFDVRPNDLSWWAFAMQLQVKI